MSRLTVQERLYRFDTNINAQMSVQEASRLLDIPDGTLHNWYVTGRIIGVELPGLPRHVTLDTELFREEILNYTAKKKFKHKKKRAKKVNGADAPLFREVEEVEEVENQADIPKTIGLATQILEAATMLCTLGESLAELAVEVESAENVREKLRAVLSG